MSNEVMILDGYGDGLLMIRRGGPRISGDTCSTTVGSSRIRGEN